jgi:hypothetical protein
VLKEETFDEFVHGASAAAVRERDLLVSEFVLSAPRALHAREEWRRVEVARHICHFSFAPLRLCVSCFLYQKQNSRKGAKAQRQTGTGEF